MTTYGQDQARMEASIGAALTALMRATDCAVRTGQEGMANDLEQLAIEVTRLGADAIRNKRSRYRPQGQLRLQ